MIAGGNGVYRTESGGIHYDCPPVGCRRTDQISVAKGAGAGKVSEGGVEGGLGVLRRIKTGRPWPREALGTANAADNCVRR